MVMWCCDSILQAYRSVMVTFFACGVVTVTLRASWRATLVCRLQADRLSAINIRIATVTFMAFPSSVASAPATRTLHRRSEWLGALIRDYSGDRLEAIVRRLRIRKEVHPLSGVGRSVGDTAGWV